VEGYAGHSVTPETARKWYRGVELYWDYCSLNGCLIDGVPVYPSADVLASFAVWLTDFKGSSARDTRQRVLGVARWTEGLEPARGDPRNGPNGRMSFLLYSVLRGIQRQHACKKRRREALTCDKLNVLLAVLQGLPELSVGDRTMYAAALTLGVYGLCRCGEITSPTTTSQDDKSPRLEDVRVFRDEHGRATHYEFTVRGSKTDIFRQGATLRVYATGTAYCPVALMERYLRTSAGRAPGAPLFVRTDGRNLTRDNVNTRIKDLARRAGFNPERFSTHSMRAGGATSLALLGYSAATIQRLGRWVSDVYTTYIVISEDAHRDAHRQMSRMAPCSSTSRAAAARVANEAWSRLRRQL
jgi:hypothetical protein